MKKTLVKDVDMNFKISDYNFSLDDIILIEKTDERMLDKGVDVIVIKNNIKKYCDRKTKLF